LLATISQRCLRPRACEVSLVPDASHVVHPSACSLQAKAFGCRDAGGTLPPIRCDPALQGDQNTWPDAYLLTSPTATIDAKLSTKPRWDRVFCPFPPGGGRLGWGEISVAPHLYPPSPGGRSSNRPGMPLCSPELGAYAHRYTSPRGGWRRRCTSCRPIPAAPETALLLRCRGKDSEDSCASFVDGGNVVKSWAMSYDALAEIHHHNVAAKVVERKV